MSTCPACPARRKIGYPICATCWKRLPGRLRSDLLGQWKLAYNALGNNALWSEYQRSRRVAVVWLRRHPA